MGDYAEFDENEPPIIKVRVVEEPNDENYGAYLNRLGDAFRRHERFALLFNTGELSAFPAKYREMQTYWLEQTEREFRGRWVCAAFVIKHRVIRGVLATMYWLNPPYYAYKVASEEEEALRFIRAQLAGEE